MLPQLHVRVLQALTTFAESGSSMLSPVSKGLAPSSQLPASSMDVPSGNSERLDSSRGPSSAAGLLPLTSQGLFPGGELLAFGQDLPSSSRGLEQASPAVVHSLGDPLLHPPVASTPASGTRRSAASKALAKQRCRAGAKLAEAARKKVSKQRSDIKLQSRAVALFICLVWAASQSPSHACQSAPGSLFSACLTFAKQPSCPSDDALPTSSMQELLAPKQLLHQGIIYQNIRMLCALATHLLRCCRSLSQLT